MTDTDTRTDTRMERTNKECALDAVNLRLDGWGRAQAVNELLRRCDSLTSELAEAKAMVERKDKLIAIMEPHDGRIIVTDLVRAIHGWAAEEDGIPDNCRATELDPTPWEAYVQARAYLTEVCEWKPLAEQQVREADDE